MKYQPIAPEGYPYVIGAAVLTVLLYLIWFWLTIAGVLLTVFFLFFFRNPQRTGAADPQAFISPADGKIMAISKLDHEPFISGKAIRITIFLSVFNVHINRAPMDGLVKAQVYKQGKFLPAFKPHASELNESNTICFENNDCRFIVRQVTGFLARRIVSDLKQGQDIVQRQRFGMIKFGSCTELIIPEEYAVMVSPGQHVYGGKTVLARKTL